MMHYALVCTNSWPYTMQGRIQDFKLGGGALKKFARKLLGYFVWKIMILRQKILFFPILGGGAPPPLDPPLLKTNWTSFLCGKHRAYNSLNLLEKLIMSPYIYIDIFMTSSLRACWTNDLIFLPYILTVRDIIKRYF